MRPLNEMDMFENIPDDVPAQYLSGAAAFVRSGGEQSVGMEKGDFTFILNEWADVARVPTGEGDDARASAKVVSKDNDDFGDGDYLGPEDYTSNVLAEEAEAWARAAVSE